MSSINFLGIAVNRRRLELVVFLAASHPQVRAPEPTPDGWGGGAPHHSDSSDPGVPPHSLVTLPQESPPRLGLVSGEHISPTTVPPR